MHDSERRLAPTARPMDLREPARSGPTGPDRAAPEGGELDQPLDAASVLGLQRRVGNAATVQLLADSDPSLVHQVVGRGGGSPLPDGVRGPMEQSFGRDFSGVRVHNDATAVSSAKAVQAKAYTVGSDIVLGEGMPSLDSDAGRHTLAHELTHVVQQSQGPVDGTPAGDGVSVSDPSDRFERQAEQTAATVMSGGAAPGVSSGGGGVQREADDDDVVSRLALQREGAPEEEELQM